jgi:N utilization substance protein A
MPDDMHETDSISKFTHRTRLNHTEPHFDEKRRKLGFENELMKIRGVSGLMLVVFGEHGIKSTEDLAGCATDDLHGWIELKRGRRFRHAGILDGFGLSRTDCESIIINARINAGWIAGPNDHPNDP